MSVVEDILGAVIGAGTAISIAWNLEFRRRTLKLRTIDECQCTHASAFHDGKGCSFGSTGGTVWDPVRRCHVDVRKCGCRRFVRLGTKYDPNLEGDIAKLELIAKIQQEYADTHNPPNVQKRPWPNA